MEVILVSKNIIQLLMTRKKSVCNDIIFKAIFDKHSEAIRNFIYYKCGNMEQAEDITQDAYVQLWKNCKKVVFEKAKSYVMKVAQNAYYNEVDHQKVILKYEQSVVVNEKNDKSPEFLMEQKEFIIKLQQSIADLPTKQREVFLLSRKDKKTYKEIAEIIGLTQKAVERRMHLALMELREKIGEVI